MNTSIRLLENIKNSCLLFYGGRPSDWHVILPALDTAHCYYVILTVAATRIGRSWLHVNCEHCPDKGQKLGGGIVNGCVSIVGVSCVCVFVLGMEQMYWNSNIRSIMWEFDSSFSLRI